MMPYSRSIHKTGGLWMVRCCINEIVHLCHICNGSNIIVKWLYQFAEKSEHDLDMVVDFLFEKQKALQEKYRLHANLFWYALRVIENFRKIEEPTKTIKEIKAFL